MNPATAGFSLRTGGAGSKGWRYSAIHPEIRLCRIERPSHVPILQMTCCLNLLMREARQGLCIAPAGRARFKKTCTKPVPHNWYRFRAISYSLNQFCPVEQLFSPRLCATFERKLKYETVRTIIYPESLPVAGSKGVEPAGPRPPPRDGTRPISPLLPARCDTS